MRSARILDRPGIEPVTLSMVMLNTRAFTASAIWALKRESPEATEGTNGEDVTTVTSNSTQTPSDLSPPNMSGDDILPQAHHQNPGHCIASFSAINRMRQNAQVSKQVSPTNKSPANHPVQMRKCGANSDRSTV
ncbi:hypothetical protein RP20_CCG009638 [Aedes albopictus]|nr:hypothetical protein RP20_CCG009638 [Aedes albopictus]